MMSMRMRHNVVVILGIAAAALLTLTAEAASRRTTDKPVTATSAAPAPTRKAARRVKWNMPRHWHKGYGFLPGFSPAERRERARDRWRADRRYQYFYGGPGYWSSRPGFYNNRWNGGGFGPCWTRTPIGPIWNCG